MEDLIFPINLAVWGYSALALILFGLRNLRLYNRSSNRLYLSFARFMLTVGFALALYSFPGLFTSSESTLTVTMIIAYTFIVGSMILNTYTQYYIGMITRFQHKIYIAIQSLLTLIVAITSLSNLRIYYETWFMGPDYGWVIGLSCAISFAITMIPTGIFFLQHSFKESDGRRKRKSLAFSFIYLGGTSAAIYLVGVLQGKEDLISTVTVFVSFTVLLWLALKPITTDSIESTPLQRVERKKSL